MFECKCIFAFFPCCSDGKESACIAGVRSMGQEVPLRREWQPTPVFLPGELHGLRSLAGYSPWRRRVGHDWATYTFLFQERSPLSSLASPWNLWSQKGNESLPWCGPQPGRHKHLLHSLMHSQWRILTALFLNALVIILIMHLWSCIYCQRFAGELVGAYRSVSHCKTVLPPFPSP